MNVIKDFTQALIPETSLKSCTRSIDNLAKIPGVYIPEKCYGIS